MTMKVYGENKINILWKEYTSALKELDIRIKEVKKALHPNSKETPDACQPQVTVHKFSRDTRDQFIQDTKNLSTRVINLQEMLTLLLSGDLQQNLGHPIEQFEQLKHKDLNFRNSITMPYNTLQFLFVFSNMQGNINSCYEHVNTLRENFESRMTLSGKQNRNIPSLFNICLSYIRSRILIQPQPQ